MSASGPTLGPEYLRRLERLQLRVRRVLSGSQRAERRSKRLGSSLEFADYRTYAAGDDPRRIDWGIFGRLERLVTRLYEEEEDLSVAILVDGSASMRWKEAGEAVSQKWELTLQLAASLAYLGLHNLDRVGLWFFDETLRSSSGVFRGRSSFHQVVRFLSRPPPPGTTDLAASLELFVQRSRRKALALVLSDGLDPGGPREGLAALAGARFELHLIHVMDPRECEPAVLGDLQLRDIESGEELQATASPGLLAAFRQEVDAFREGLKTWCRQRAAGYSFVRTDARFDEVVLRMLRQDGLLR